MKKVSYFGLFATLMLIMASCGSPSTPGAAAKQYAEYIQKGNYEKFADGIVLDEKMDAAKVKEAKEGLTAMLKEKVSKEIEKKEGIKNIEIVSEEVAEDGNTAKVILKQTYGNGETEENTYDMIKKDGSWKMDMKK